MNASAAKYQRYKTSNTKVTKYQSIQYAPLFEMLTASNTQVFNMLMQYNKNNSSVTQSLLPVMHMCIFILS